MRKRSDEFYYFELWHTKELRNKVINGVLDINKKIRPKYFCGTPNSPTVVNFFQLSNVWKLRETAETNLKNIIKYGRLDEYKVVIKNMNREEFIKRILLTNENLGALTWIANKQMQRNRGLAHKEHMYIEKLKKSNNHPV